MAIKKSLKGGQGLSRQTLNSNISKTTKDINKILENYESSEKNLLKKIF